VEDLEFCVLRLAVAVMVYAASGPMSTPLHLERLIFAQFLLNPFSPVTPYSNPWRTAIYARYVMALVLRKAGSALLEIIKNLSPSLDYGDDIGCSLGAISPSQSYDGLHVGTHLIHGNAANIYGRLPSWIVTCRHEWFGILKRNHMNIPGRHLR
jgi:hypothetical protein